MNTSPPEPDNQVQPYARLFRGLRIGSIRARLLVAFMLLVVLPAITISISTVSVGLRHGQQQVINQLQSVATLKDEQIETWLESLQTHLSVVLYPHQVQRLVHPLLTSTPGSPAYDQAYADLSIQFAQMIATTGQFEEVFLLNRQGQVVLSTNRSSEGQVHSAQAYFWHGLREPYIQSLSSATAQGLSSPVVVSRPVIGQDGTVSAVVAGRASANRLNAIMLQRTGLGQTGETYLVGTNFLLLTDSRFEDRNTHMLRLWTPTLETVFRTRIDRSGLYRNYRGQRVVGVYHWLPSLQMVLVAEQEQGEAFHPTYATLWINVTVAVVAVLIALLSALLVARSIATPLANLANTATRIAAGDLSLSARVARNDEVGALATAFNRMTARLRQVIGNLKQRIGELQQAEAEVRRVNAYLARDVAEQATLHRLSNMLQCCQTLDEAYAGSVPLLRELFANHAGAFYRCTGNSPALERVGQWGDYPAGPLPPPEARCLALSADNHETRSDVPVAAEPCRICISNALPPVLCVPVQTANERSGLLHVWVGHSEDAALHNHLVHLATRSADLLALALSNLRLREDLREQVLRDPLTGLFNRRFLHETLEKMLSYAQRHGRTVAVYLLDLDHFKQINDTYGHDAGDTVLRTVGALLQTRLRGEDIACRLGGEELLLALPEITAHDALARADALRQALYALDIDHAGTHLPAITVSIGIAVFPEHGQTSHALISAADQALYDAKRSGRNRVCLAACSVSALER